MQTFINTRVRATPKSFVGDAEIQHQRKRTRCIREVTSQLFVTGSTSLTPSHDHLFRFRFVCCPKEVSDLINLPVVRLFVTRVTGTSTEVVTKIDPLGEGLSETSKRVYLKLPATTRRKCHFHIER
jgi:hypothetical protein